MQGDRRVDGAQAATLLDEADEAHLRRGQRRVEIGMGGGNALGHQALARLAVGAEEAFQRGGTRSARGRDEGGDHFFTHLQIVGRAAAQGVAHARQLRVADDVGHVAVDVLDA